MGNAQGKKKKGKKNEIDGNAGCNGRASPPGPPEVVYYDGESEAITLRWDPPVTDGGSSIIGYIMEMRPLYSEKWQRCNANDITDTEYTLSGLKPENEYQFRVSAVNNEGLSYPSEASEPVGLASLNSSSTFPKFIKELRDVTALEHERVEFYVEVWGTPFPSITWFRDGLEVFGDRKVEITTEAERSSLVIRHVTLHDQGDIKCIAINRAGTAETKSILLVEAPPSLDIPRQYDEGVLVEAGEILRLKVAFTGRPIPKVIWSHEGIELTTGGRYEIESSDRSSTLRVLDSQRDDRGEYGVRLESHLGEDMTTILVTVTDRPQPPGKPEVKEVNGTHCTLEWAEPKDDGGCKIGTYVLEYYRVGWNVWLKAATSRTPSTTMTELIPGSEYLFRVKAENPYGQSEPSEECGPVFLPDPSRGIMEPVKQKQIIDWDGSGEILVPSVPPRQKKRSAPSSPYPIKKGILKKRSPSPPPAPEEDDDEDRSSSLEIIARFPPGDTDRIRIRGGKDKDFDLSTGFHSSSDSTGFISRQKVIQPTTVAPISDIGPEFTPPCSSSPKLGKKKFPERRTLPRAKKESTPPPQQIKVLPNTPPIGKRERIAVPIPQLKRQPPPAHKSPILPVKVEKVPQPPLQLPPVAIEKPPETVIIEKPPEVKPSVPVNKVLPKRGHSPIVLPPKRDPSPIERVLPGVKRVSSVVEIRSPSPMEKASSPPSEKAGSECSSTDDQNLLSDSEEDLRRKIEAFIGVEEEPCYSSSRREGRPLMIPVNQTTTKIITPKEEPEPLTIRSPTPPQRTEQEPIYDEPSELINSYEPPKYRYISKEYQRFALSKPESYDNDELANDELEYEEESYEGEEELISDNETEIPNAAKEKEVTEEMKQIRKYFSKAVNIALLFILAPYLFSDILIGFFVLSILCYFHFAFGLTFTKG